MSQIVPPTSIGKNKFVSVNPVSGVFEEFSIKVGEKIEGKNFVKLLVRPPVIRGGFLAFGKKIYQLSLHDILRGHFNATKPYIRTTNTTTTCSELATPVDVNPTSNTNQQGPEDTFGTDIDEAANLYFEEQVELLFNIED